MIDFNNIVKIVGKKGGNVIFKKDIYDIIDPEQKDKYKSKVDKTIYRLKSEGYIISLKAGVYIVPDKDDAKMNLVELIEKYYVKLLKKYISYYVGSDYYISGVKSLEIHDRNYSIPIKMYITTRNINKKIQIGDYAIIFKSVSGKYMGKKINLFTKFNPYTEKKEIDGIIFKIAGIELALLEGALLGDIDESLNIKLLNKILKKYKGSFRLDIFYELGKYKYIMSFNRLKELVKKIDNGLYMVFLDVIKKNGGLFIGEGLRGF